MNQNIHAHLICFAASIHHNTPTSFTQPLHLTLFYYLILFFNEPGWALAGDGAQKRLYLPADHVHLHSNTLEEGVQKENNFLLDGGWEFIAKYFRILYRKMVCDISRSNWRGSYAAIFKGKT